MDDKLLKQQVKLLGLPGGGRLSSSGYEWSKEGGFAGAKAIDRVSERASELDWDPRSDHTASATGSTINATNTWTSPDGAFVLKTYVSWGVTKDSNRFSIRLSAVEPKVDVRGASNENRLREMASMKDGSNERLIMSALQQGGGAASFIADTVDQAALASVAKSKGVRSKAMGNEIVAWMPGKQPPNVRLENKMVRVKLSELRQIVSEELSEKLAIPAVVLDDLKSARQWMGRMNNMTPFSMWGKGDHKKAQQALAKAYRALGAAAKKAGDKELAKAASDAAYYALRGNTDYDTKEAVNAGIARHTKPAAPPVSEALLREDIPCDVCGEAHPPYWEDDDDAELSIDDDDPACHFNQPKPNGWQYKRRRDNI